MSKLDEIKATWPDAKQYYEKNQFHVSEENARVATYGKEVKAKCVFERSIPSSKYVTQQYIFSEAAAKEVEDEQD